MRITFYITRDFVSRMRYKILTLMIFMDEQGTPMVNPTPDMPTEGNAPETDKPAEAGDQPAEAGM